MARRRVYPIQTVLRRLFWYDGVDGCLRWNGNRDTEGIEAGDRAAIQGQDGYMHVNCFGKKYKEHLLIWIHQMGEIPDKHDIDHIDRNRTNNLLTNLRPASTAQNLANRNRWGSSAFKGVYPAPNGKRYRAIITISGKTKHLGTFDTPEEAAKVYDEAARKAFGEYAGTNEDNT